jgi:predicted PolB exonuclease-like 3'-5' exonuclease
MSTRGYLVFDIETVPDLDLYQHPEVPTGTERPFPPLWAHRPIAIGALLLDETYGFRRLGVFGEDKGEAAMLADFGSFCEQHRPHLVTYNGRGFDLPVIQLRCLRHGLPLRFLFSDKDYRYRFSEAGHLDLYDVMGDYGAAKVGSLDALARLIGLPGKVGVDGSQVEGLFHAGQLEAIRRYCLSDVVQTAFLLLRWRLLQGQLDGPTYRMAALRLLESLASDGRVAAVLDKIDRPRRLLEG